MTIEAIAVRGFALDGVSHAKGAALSLPENQFADLKAVGLVEKAPKAKAPAKAD
jgi:hypothetical protein